MKPTLQENVDYVMNIKYHMTIKWSIIMGLCGNRTLFCSKKLILSNWQKAEGGGSCMRLIGASFSKAKFHKGMSIGLRA